MTVFVITINSYRWFKDGHFTHEAFGDSLYQKNRSMTYLKLPKAERLFYTNFEEQVHKQHEFEGFTKVIEKL